MAAPSMDDFDFVNLLIHDVHGYPKGRMMSKKRLAGIVKNGLGIYGGLCFFGIRGEVSLHEDFGKNSTYVNTYLKPLIHTLKPCPTLGQGYIDPAHSCRNTNKKLQTELGLTIKSAFEMEFNIRDSESKKYFAHEDDWGSINVLEHCQKLLFDMVHELDERGVHVDSLQTEHGPGQFELTIDVAEGIEAPEKTVECKNIIKIFLKSRGYDAAFMTTVEPIAGTSNGFHFNHSLWTTTGENAFVDTSKPNKLSELGSHWLAGLVEHAPGMTAFCNPTINCYRRIGQPFAPSFADWSCHGRLETFRLKVENGDNVYIESRLPTSACNPYLAVICTIAAGLDGVKRKLPLPQAFTKTCHLPTDLESALQVLEADTVLTEAMGAKLVEYFAHSKRTYELKPFADFGKLTETEQFNKEKEFYFLNA